MHPRELNDLLEPVNELVCGAISLPLSVDNGA